MSQLAIEMFRAYVGWQYIFCVDRTRQLMSADSYARAMRMSSDERYTLRAHVIFHLWR